MVLDGRRIILIDTPGFDDTYKSDTEILELIAKHLSITFEAGKLLNGIILLQPINANRVVGQERKRTRLFEKICGENAYRNVVIATTFWGEIGDKAKGIAREKERIQNDGFWGQLVKKGARTARHENNKESALDVVRMLLDKPKVALQMQQEMAANGGRFGDTSAGLELNKELNEQCAKLAMELVETKAEARKSKEDLTEEIKALKEKMELLEEQKELIEASRVSKRPMVASRSIEPLQHDQREDEDDGCGFCCRCLLILCCPWLLCCN